MAGGGSNVSHTTSFYLSAARHLRCVECGLCVVETQHLRASIHRGQMRKQRTICSRTISCSLQRVPRSSARTGRFCGVQRNRCANAATASVRTNRVSAAMQTIFPVKPLTNLARFISAFSGDHFSLPADRMCRRFFRVRNQSERCRCAACWTSSVATYSQTRTAMCPVDFYASNC